MDPDLCVLGQVTHLNFFFCKMGIIPTPTELPWELNEIMHVTIPIQNKFSKHFLLLTSIIIISVFQLWWSGCLMISGTHFLTPWLNHQSPFSACLKLHLLIFSIWLSHLLHLGEGSLLEAFFTHQLKTEGSYQLMSVLQVPDSKIMSFTDEKTEAQGSKVTCSRLCR